MIFMLLNMVYHLAKRKRKLTIISTASRIMQLISLAPAPTRAFADIETFGPICLQSYRVSYILSLEYIPIRKVKHFSISKKQPTEHDL
jgi:hypothetical protein